MLWHNRVKNSAAARLSNGRRFDDARRHGAGGMDAAQRRPRNPPRSHVAAVCYRPAFEAASFSTLRMSIFAIMMSEAEIMPITHG